MKHRKAFKFQLKANPAHRRAMSRFAGCSRFVWNKALALQKDQLDAKKHCLSYFDLAPRLVSWKNEETTAFLKEVHSQPLQQTLKNLDRAIKEAFSKKNPKQFPRFKKRGLRDSFHYPQGFKIDERNSRIFLPKIGYISYRNSRSIEGKPKNVIVSRHLDVWYISIQVELEVVPQVHEQTSAIGIDMGITKFATLSDGSYYKPINSFRKHAARLRFYQRRLKNKKKFSSNWRKAIKKVQCTHHKISNVRQDYLQKTSTTISKNHAIVVLEDLQVKNMSRSAAGTKENPGTQVKAKSGLNKSILDQGWGEFRRQLEYKQQWRGGKVIAIPPQNTSRKCSSCGCIAAANRKTQARFKCISCHFASNADINAARNILAAGHAVLACGETASLSRSMKQEPSLSAAPAA